MKPLKLVMNAFGPYAGRQEIDFTRFDGHNIFVVTGPTGAGKTTIFDAISFALFGDSSGDARESENFKSDYAGPDAVCSVELTFLLKGKKYRIERCPKQTRLSSRGNLRTINSDALLTLADGTVVAGVRNVDPLIVSLLGISRDRFKQIAMLPQGEYKKLLYADSREKQEIFRKVFSTQIYMKVTDALREQARTLEEYLGERQRDIQLHIAMYKTENEQLRALIHAAQQDIPQIFDCMDTELEQDRRLAKEMETDVHSMTAKIQALGYAEAVRINTRFDLLETTRARKKQFEEKRESAALLEQTISRIHRAKELSYIHQELTTLENSLDQQRIQLTQTQQKLALVQQQAEKQEIQQKSLPKIQKKRDTLAAFVSSLEQEAQTVGLLEQAKAQLAILQAGEKKLQNREQIFSLFFTRKETLARLDSISTLEQLSKELLAQVESFWKASAEYEQAQLEYDSAYTTFLQGQAGLLAASLREGKPCPVCGSVHHPFPAPQRGKIPSEEELQNCKKQVDACTQSLREIDTRARILLEKLLSSWKEEDPLGIQENRLYQSKTRLQALCEILKNEAKRILAKAKETDAALAGYRGITKEVLRDPRYREETFLQQLREKNTQDLSQQSGKIHAAEERIATLQGQLKNGIFESQVLREKIDQTKQEEQILYKQAEDITRAYQEGQTALARVQESLRGLMERLSADEALFNKKQMDFNVRLHEMGFFTKQEFEQALVLLQKEQEYQHRLEEYRKDCSNCDSQLSMLEEELSGKQRQDTVAIKAREEALKLEQEQCTSRLSTLQAGILSNEEHRRQAGEIYQAIGDKQEEYARVTRLYRMANGNNDAKVDFERYVLAAYFDDIIEASNQRLAKMTGYRYTLQRKLERGKYAKASGLDFEIIDSYTGKARDITTLSGGESFQASLALALGVADVMQMYSGGIEMNTMFIDEGFGTLDPQSLDEAIRTLMDLTTGERLIGVISHVSELQERIPAQVAVSSSRTGSSIRVIV